jgi:protein-disulfide isomerase
VLLAYGEQVRFVWRDFPIITVHSWKAAEAGQCAHEQGKFWEYHNLAFLSAPRLGVEDLKTYAADIGLDTDRFNQCLDSGRYETAVKEDLQDAQERGFRGTPTFLINDQVVVGPPSYDMLVERIEAALAEGG